MLRKSFFVLCLMAVAVVASYAQARRTVTNTDLDRYRQQRVAAERELREDYVRLGFASPEDMARKNFDSQQQMIELSQRLKADRLERERMELERERMMMTLLPPVPYGYGGAIQPGEPFWPTVWGDGFGGFGHRTGRVPQQHGYFAGGQFWPTGAATPARPAFVTPRPGPHH